MRFSEQIIHLCNKQLVNVVSRTIIDQLVRSATSIGANYSEANNAASKADFKNKIFIAKKEAAETKYWLTLFKTITDDQETCAQLSLECQYLLMTFQKIISTMKYGKQKMENAR